MQSLSSEFSFSFFFVHPSFSVSTHSLSSGKCFLSLCVCVCWLLKKLFFFLLRKIQHLPGWNMPNTDRQYGGTARSLWNEKNFFLTIYFYYYGSQKMNWLKHDNELCYGGQKTSEKEKKNELKWKWKIENKLTLGGKAIEWKNEKRFSTILIIRIQKLFFFTPQNFYDLWICVDGNRIFRRIFFCVCVCDVHITRMNYE